MTTLAIRKEKPFVSPLIAGVRLLNLAIDHILCYQLQPGIEVRWELAVKIRYSEEAKKNHKGPALLQSFKCSSGFGLKETEEDLKQTEEEEEE